MGKKFFAAFLSCLLICLLVSENSLKGPVFASGSDGKDYIKWVDFDVTYEALEDAFDLDITTYEQDLHISWIDTLAYLACIYGGDFSSYKKSDLVRFANQLNEGKSIEDLTREMKHFSYYYKAYSAVLTGFLGLDENGYYGLSAYSPIADGFWYTDSDDFGNGRSYGFARKHLGHDLFCSVGTPIVAVEGGKVEALGWNQYGGWRIGIRSHDGLRYYYYAHLRKDSPYIDGLEEGTLVKAGQIIGYSGQSGYSIKENVNNINVPHLHFGMQLIFDKSQEDCNSEIWIDTYGLIRLLSKHRASEAAQYAATPALAEEIDVPVLMYHGLTKKQSQVNAYFIPVSTFESDLKYLKEHGYETITFNQLIEYVYDKTGRISLPEKPVILTFDDGYCNNYNYASPLLEKYNMQAVISVIGYACEEASEATYRAEDYCNVTWNQIREMASSGHWEIQNHTWSLHEIKDGRKGASRKAGESTAAYEKILQENLSILQEKLKETTGIEPNIFTWPFGAYSEESDALLKSMGFLGTLSCNGGINKISRGDTEGLFLLKRQLRTPEASISALLDQS